MSRYVIVYGEDCNLAISDNLEDAEEACRESEFTFFIDCVEQKVFSHDEDTDSIKEVTVSPWSME